MIFSIITCFFIRLEEINQKKIIIYTFVDSEFQTINKSCVKFVIKIILMRLCSS